MTTESFQAMMVDEIDKKPCASLKMLTMDQLPDLDVLVEIAFSGLNYKDGLAISGRQRIVRRPPLVAGIDLAGTIIESRDPQWRTGDRVLVNGWGLSETQNGGYTRYQRLSGEWLTVVPERFTFEQAMAIGTAGYTAALCVEALEGWDNILPASGPILVTGAAGGVGSVSIALLAARGFGVTASSGRPEATEYLKSLGAQEVIDRSLLGEPGAPLQKERWMGVIDSVGSITLANVLAQTRYGGAVAACGLAGGTDLPASVLPHILRGVALLGIDSVMAPRDRRQRAWARLERDLDIAKLESMTRVEPMTRLPELAEEIVTGKVRGRVVIDVKC